MAADYLLAIDLGTTGITGMVFDRDARVRSRASSEFRQCFPRPGWVEHDPEEIWRVTLDVAQDALGHAGLGVGDLHALGLTNQRETVVLWDRASGVPVAPAIVWQDRRTADRCDALRAEGHEELFRDKTGLVIDPYFSGTKLAWYLDHLPGVRGRAEAGELAFGTIDSWLVWKLTGGSVHVTDYSNASRTLLFNLHTLDWDPELLEILNLPRVLLPATAPSSRVYGETDPDAFLGARLPIGGMAGDQQAALFGQACYGEGLAKNTYGTGSFVLANTGGKPVDARPDLLTTVAWGLSDGTVEYALEAAIFVTGAAVQWLRDGLGIIKTAADSETLAASVPDNGGVYFVPALTGLGAPYWDPYARGTLVGLTRGSTAAHLARATLEGIAFQTRDAVEAMNRQSKTDLRELRADGGGAANGLLMQFQADLLGIPVVVPEVTETTALGAAYLAGLSTGFWTSRRELDARWRVARRYEPRMKNETRKRLCDRWREAVARAQGWAKPTGQE